MKIKPLMIKLTLPIVIQNIISFLGNTIDSIMLGNFSEAAFSAASLSNQLFFIMTMVISGIAGGSNVLIAQYYGKKDIAGIRKTLGYTYIFTIFFVITIFMLGSVGSSLVMKLLTDQTVLIANGVVYLRYVSWSYIFYGITSVTIIVLRSFHHVDVGMKASILALLINSLLNYCLIFGKFGFPQLGLMGAGIATSIARGIELFYVVVVVLRNKLFPLGAIGDLIRFDFNSLKLFSNCCAPVVANEFMYSLGESCIAMIIGRLGPNVVSAIAVYTVIGQLSSVLMNGTNSAACVIVGNTIGSNKLGELGTLKKNFQRLAIIVGIVDGLLMLLTIPLIPYLYDLTPQSYNVCQTILILGSIVEIFKSYQCMNMMGLLRGAGDVTFACLNDIVFLWFCALPLGLLSAFAFHAPVAIVFISIKSDQILKCFTSSSRLKSSRWIHQI